MTPTEKIRAEVAVAALLDVACLRTALADDEVLADVALWGAAGHDGATEVLASHPRFYDLVAPEVLASPAWAAVRATAWSERVRPMFRNTRRTMFLKPAW